MKHIYPCLWFEGNAKEAVDFYLSVFPNSKINETVYYTADGPGGKIGDILTIDFELNGMKFIVVNGGPYEKHTAAISLVAPCENQEEVDTLWEKLSQGGKIEQCGWLRDKYGVTWQITPIILSKMIADKNQAKAKAVLEAMMEMVKLDIAELQKAYDSA